MTILIIIVLISLAVLGFTRIVRHFIVILRGLNFKKRGKTFLFKIIIYETVPVCYFFNV